MKKDVIVCFIAASAVAAPAVCCATGPSVEASAKISPVTGSSHRAAVRRMSQRLAIAPTLQPVVKKNIENFAADFSWKAIFKPEFNSNQMDLTTRRLRTDLEVDDAEKFMKMVLELSDFIQETGFLPQLDVVCSEGSAETIKKKTLTLKALLAHMAAHEIADPRVLQCFQLYCDAPSAAGDEKELGYDNIHQAALKLVTFYPEMGRQANLRANQYFHQLAAQSAPSVEEMYRAFDRKNQQLQQSGHQPRIVEIAIAPITGLVKYYSAHPELLNHVELSGYGSFNIAEGVEKLAGVSLKDPGGPEAVALAAKAVEDVLNKASKVFLYEAYLATRVQVNPNEKSEPIYTDFNRMGFQDQPQVFEPLFDKNRNDLQEFILKAKKGWNDPLETKFKKQLMALPKGEEFLTRLQDAITREGASFSDKRALEIANSVFDQSVLTAKVKGQIRILSNMWSNQGIQGTISDLAVAELLSDQTLIEPTCLHSGQRIKLEVGGGRVNTVFVDDPSLEHHYAILSKPDKGVSGIRLDRLKDAVHDFYVSLGK